MNYKTIIVEAKDNIGYLKLNNPKKLNLLSQELIGELESAINYFSTNYDLKVLIISSVSKDVFSAGGELNEIAAADYDLGLAMCLRLQRVYSGLQNLEIPVIAALDGYVLGGGLELALHCDIRFAGENTILRLPESDIGLIPAAGGICMFSKYFSLADSAYYLFTGNQIPIEKALEKGFVQKIYKSDELMIETEKFAKLLCTKSSQSLRAIKKILISSMFLDVNELLEMEAREFSSVLQTDGKERIKQFFEKRNKV